MSVAIFFAGTLTGVAAMILLALWLAARPKTEAGPQHNGIAATSVSLSGNSGESMDAHHDRLLRQVLKQASDGRLYEIKTRH
jgi:hypothetical protein